MAASAAAQALLTDSVVASNTANSGAGVYAVAQVTLTVAGGSVHNNTSNTDGGGLYAAGALIADRYVSVYGNQANGGRGGGVYVGSTGNACGRRTLPEQQHQRRRRPLCGASLAPEQRRRAEQYHGQ
jgi:predicted outer membrane repeat protein